MRLLGDADTSISELKENVAHHMSFVHQSVEECCNVYTTPELPRSHPALPDPVQELVREGGCDEGAPPEGPVKLRGASTQVAEPPRCSTPSSCSPMSPRIRQSGRGRLRVVVELMLDALGTASGTSCKPAGCRTRPRHASCSPRNSSGCTTSPKTRFRSHTLSRRAMTRSRTWPSCRTAVVLTLARVLCGSRSPRVGCCSPSRSGPLTVRSGIYRCHLRSASLRTCVRH